MIKVHGNKVVFTGTDAQQFKEIAKSLGLSQQEVFTGMMWEMVMKYAREGLFTCQKRSGVARFMKKNVPNFSKNKKVNVRSAVKPNPHLKDV